MGTKPGWAGFGFLRTNTRQTAFLLLGALLGLSARANAQTEEELVARRIALGRAETAAQEGRHEEALALAQRAGQVQMTPSIRLFLSREHRELRQFAAGLGQADACVREATRDAAMPNRELVLTSCRTLLQQLQTQVATLTLRVDGALPPELEVRVNNTLVSRALLGLPYAVDPGTVVVRATAPGRLPYLWAGSLSAATDRVFVLSLPENPSSTASAPPTPPSTPQTPPRPRSLAPFALVGVGGAALLASAVFYGLRVAATDGCVVSNDVGYCNSMQRVERATREAPLFNGLAIGSLAVGGAAVAAGLLWWGLSPAPSREANNTSTLRWMVLPQGAGFSW